MLEAIQDILGGRVRSTWVDEVTTWGTLVKLYRDYAEGNHRAKLTPEMKAMLRVDGSQTDQFNVNLCDMVVQAMTDRLTVDRIDGGSDPANTWAADVLAWNRFDGLQMDVHEAAIRDGVTFVMVGYDNDAQMPVIAHEPAWDGECGMIAIYDRMARYIVAAVKVWYEGDVRRCNVYLPDRVIKYEERDGALRPLSAETWTMRDGSPVGVPVVPFRNRGKARQINGVSEEAVMIPMQDALNRTLVSMVMTGELTAFQIRVALGFDPPAKVTPGMWVTIPEVPVDQKVDAFVLEQGQLVPFISQAQFLIDQIGVVSRTPLPQFLGGDNASGESLKQREVGLLGKVRRFQVKGGNSWEDVMTLCARVQDAYGKAQPPAAPRWNCQWQEAEVRNDAEVVKNVMEVKGLIGEEEALRQLAPVFGWDEAKIQLILAAKRTAAADSLAGSLNMLADYQNFRAN